MTPLLVDYEADLWSYMSHHTHTHTHTHTTRAPSTAHYSVSMSRTTKCWFLMMNKRVSWRPSCSWQILQSAPQLDQPAALCISVCCLLSTPLKEPQWALWGVSIRLPCALKEHFPKPDKFLNFPFNNTDSPGKFNMFVNSVNLRPWDNIWQAHKIIKCLSQQWPSTASARTSIVAVTQGFRTNPCLS